MTGGKSSSVQGFGEGRKVYGLLLPCYRVLIVLMTGLALAPRLTNPALVHPLTTRNEPHVNTMSSDRVDVVHAIEEFNLLSRQLHVQSESASRTPNSAAASARTIVSSHDVEKGDVKDESTPFDLRAYLTSSNDANQAAGIKHKVWNRPSYTSSSINSRPLESM